MPAIGKVLFGASLLGFAAVFARFASAEATPIETGFFRMFFALPLISLIFYNKIKWRLNKAKITAAVAGSIFAIELILWHYAMTLTSAANATFIIGLSPLWVALVNRGLYREPLTRQFILGLFLSLFGALLLAMKGNMILQISKGELVALGASFAYAAYTLGFTRARVELEAEDALFFAVLGALILASLCLIPSLINDSSQVASYSTKTWLSLIGLGVLVQTLAWFIISSGLREVKSSEGAIALLMQQVATVFLGHFLLHEKMIPLDIVGSLFILTGMVLCSLSKRSQRLTSLAQK